LLALTITGSPLIKPFIFRNIHFAPFRDPEFRVSHPYLFAYCRFSFGDLLAGFKQGFPFPVVSRDLEFPVVVPRFAFAPFPYGAFGKPCLVINADQPLILDPGMNAEVPVKISPENRVNVIGLSSSFLLKYKKLHVSSSYSFHMKETGHLSSSSSQSFLNRES
jgi:hypothetical protein